MPDNVAILLVILIAANVVLIGIVLGRTAMRHRRAAAATAFAADLAATPVATHAADPRATTGTPVFEAGKSPIRSDALTDLLLPGEWSRIVTDENARFHRYGRPVTVVLIELDGLERLVATLGQDAADKVLPAVADTLRRQAREADHIARLGAGRFGVLLPETGEIEAVNYVERVREACELWLESGAIALRLAIGWASPKAETSLVDAVAAAQDRMYAELRRNARRATELTADEGATAPGFEGSPAPA